MIVAGVIIETGADGIHSEQRPPLLLLLRLLSDRAEPMGTLRAESAATTLAQMAARSLARSLTR